MLRAVVPSTERETESRLAAVERVWRENRCLTEPTIAAYRGWVRVFIEYCRRHSRQPRVELTYAGAMRFLDCHARRRPAARRTLENGRMALHRWAEALQVLGEPLPPWRPGIGIRLAPKTSRRSPALLQEYAEYMRCERGCSVRTIAVQRFYLEHLLKFLRSRGRSPRRLRLSDIDALLIQRRARWSIRTRADMCTAVRGFLRFLHVTGRIKSDLSGAVLAPRVRRDTAPRRALPWPHVKRILRGIERSTPVGRRDYALLLMMSPLWVRRR